MATIDATVMRTDQTHDAVRRFLQQLLKQLASLVLHDCVFVDAMTLLKRRGGSGVAIRAGEEMKQNPLYRWQSSTPQLDQLAWGVLERYSDKDWSYNDCALLALSPHATYWRALPVGSVIPVPSDSREAPR